MNYQRCTVVSNNRNRDPDLPKNSPSLKGRGWGLGLHTLTLGKMTVYLYCKFRPVNRRPYFIGTAMPRMGGYELQIKITKSITPIIWLDTSFLINIARAKLGRFVKPADKERSERLYEVVYRKTKQARLICPIAHQRIEYDFGELPQECYKIQETLSADGVRFADDLLIQFTQLFKVLKAHKKKRKHLTLSYRDAIEEDLPYSFKTKPPNQPSYKNLQEWQSYVVGKQKEWANEALEKFRQYNILNRITFESQLADNYNNTLWGAIAIVIRKRRELAASRKKRTPESRYQAAINEFSRLWLEFFLAPLINYAGGFGEFDKFIRSDDYRSVPQTKIGATLFAHILTNKSCLKSGDMGDISQLSIVLPYCNIVLTDRKMHNLIKKYRLDEEFGTQVYSISDFDNLVSVLDRL